MWIPARVWNDNPALPPFPKDAAYLVGQFSDLTEILIDQKTPSDADTDVVYLFVSAYHALYRQYVLDILAGPRGFSMRFPYRTVWLPGPYQTGDKPQEFCGLIKDKTAVIVFTDERVKGEPRRSPHFLPIRAVKITNAELHGDLIQIEFELGDYVSYPMGQPDVAEGYDRGITKLAYRPRLNIKNCSYLGLGPQDKAGIRFETDASRDDAAWHGIISVLGDLRAWAPFKCTDADWPAIPNPFTYAMFYRIGDLTNLKTNKQVALQPLTFGQAGSAGGIGFPLDSDTQYRLGLLFFCPKQPVTKVRESKLEVKLSPEQALTPISPVQIPLNFSYDNRDLVFTTVRTFEHLRGSISFSITNPDGDNADERTRAMAPAPMFQIKVQANRPLFWLAAGAFFIGSVVSANSESIAKLLPSDSATLIQTILAIVGSAIATFAFYWLYRTLK